MTKVICGANGCVYIPSISCDKSTSKESLDIINSKYVNPKYITKFQNTISKDLTRINNLLLKIDPKHKYSIPYQKEYCLHSQKKKDEKYINQTDKQVGIYMLYGGPNLYQIYDDHNLNSYTFVLYLLKLITGLLYLHHYDIFHLDIKSLNIVIKNNIPRYIDFDLSEIIPKKSRNKIIRYERYVSYFPIDFMLLLHNRLKYEKHNYKEMLPPILNIYKNKGYNESFFNIKNEEIIRNNKKNNTNKYIESVINKKLLDKIYKQADLLLRQDSNKYYQMVDIYQLGYTFINIKKRENIKIPIEIDNLLIKMTELDLSKRYDDKSLLYFINTLNISLTSPIKLCKNIKDKKDMNKLSILDKLLLYTICEKYNDKIAKLIIKQLNFI